MQGLGETGAQQSKDCSFAAGTVAGAPLRVSWFLVIFFVYQLLDALKAQGLPAWVRAAQVTINEALLLLTVLCHEMGHGSMARYLGGRISQVLLWPFGGICFTTRPDGRDSRQKLWDDLKIVGAGPATHFPMGGAWLMLLVAARSAWALEGLSRPWWHLVPFATVATPCFAVEKAFHGCLQSYGGYLIYSSLTQAVQLNVMLFMFNVFFPMYPLDGAKLIVCSLQLFCGASAKTAAKVLIGTSVPLCLFFVGNTLWGMKPGGGGMFAGVALYMGLMCLSESYQIYTLLKEGQLYRHPLFELARSQTVAVSDEYGMSHRLNGAAQDDEERPQARQVQFSQSAADKQKSVRQLEDERVELQRLQREAAR